MVLKVRINWDDSQKVTQLLEKVVLKLTVWQGENGLQGGQIGRRQDVDNMQVLF